jgi:hypothetical protein
MPQLGLAIQPWVGNGQIFAKNSVVYVVIHKAGGIAMCQPVQDVPRDLSHKQGSQQPK